MEGRWPSSPSNFRNASETLTSEAHKLASRILDLLEPSACPNLKPGTLSSSHTLWKSDGQCTLRLLHYPPMDAGTAVKLSAPDESTGRRYWRAGPHTDWDNITLLFQREGQAGLECCANPRDTSKADVMRWTPVDPVRGGIAVNIGDMLSRWSDGRLYSNLHRVRMPTEAECTPPSSRYSMAFFAQSNKSAEIECENSETITAGDYLLSRIKSNFAK
jgi:isopenicillin N synthase-like dioxygenase